MNLKPYTVRSHLAGMFLPALAVWSSLLTAAAQDKIVIRGSNTIGEELAPHRRI